VPISELVFGLPGQIIVPAPSIDDIVDRAHGLILDAIGAGSVRMQQACRELAAVRWPLEAFFGRIDLDQCMAALPVKRFAQTGEGAVG
jgi:hypothetical protein